MRTNYVLEAASQVDSVTWTEVPGVVNNSVTVGTSEIQKFYRLRRQ